MNKKPGKATGGALRLTDIGKNQRDGNDYLVIFTGKNGYWIFEANFQRAGYAATFCSYLAEHLRPTYETREKKSQEMLDNGYFDAESEPGKQTAV
ncbi:MAG: hypothetical protein SOS98_01600 [Varibaculum sp.]|nr:hypothetical protein [Varibaculum sp.]